MASLGRHGIGTAGSSFNADHYDFPAVPYTKVHFNPYCELTSYNSADMIRNCYLMDNTDLNQANVFVRDTIVAFLNEMVDIGVAGFRLDAAMHMWPRDITGIQNRVKDIPEGGRPFFYSEVIVQNGGLINATEYMPFGYVTEFRYSQKLTWGSQDFGQLRDVVDYKLGMVDSEHALVFVDNHDIQRSHGAILTYKIPIEYKMATAFMLANNYGFARVMSSYEFGSDSEMGPPHDAGYTAKNVTINSDGSCGNGWVCEHRWPSISSMVAFRNAVAGTNKQHWYQQGEEVAFARGNKGFFAMAKNGHMDKTLQTGLPAGEYCNLITECADKIIVDGSGNARIVINNVNDPIVAFIVGKVSLVQLTMLLLNKITLFSFVVLRGDLYCVLPCVLSLCFQSF